MVDFHDLIIDLNEHLNDLADEPNSDGRVIIPYDRLERDANGFIVNHVGLPPCACLALFSNLVGSACVHALTMILNHDHDGFKLAFHTEPVTMMDAVAMARKYACLTANPTLFQQQLRNSIRAQAIPELQANFAETVITMDGARLADVLSLPCGPAMQWEGDRELTFSYIFKDLADFLNVTGGRSLNGWEIPPLGKSSKGKKRMRRKKNGYLLPFFGEDTGCIMFGLEDCSLKLRLPLGFFGVNLLWFNGAQPSSCHPTEGGTHAGKRQAQAERVAKFDMVTRAPKDQNTTFTIGRVDDHFYTE